MFHQEVHEKNYSVPKFLKYFFFLRLSMPWYDCDTKTHQHTCKYLEYVSGGVFLPEYSSYYYAYYNIFVYLL